MFRLRVRHKKYAQLNLLNALLNAPCHLGVNFRSRQTQRVPI
jgi:hypothetical protein